MSLGSFCLVLHGHLPWVLGHGRWPHGEDWLYEAVSETWLPLLQVLDRLVADRIHPGWTVGLTPILLEQLSHPRFKRGFAHYLELQIARAESDAIAFAELDDPHLAWLATEHVRRFRMQSEAFEALDGDLCGAFAAHARNWAIELLSSNATHAYHPLVLHDRCARAQLRTGLSTSERHFGFRPPGIWLPECAYRSGGPWTPPVLHGDERHRAGVGTLCAEEGVDFFMVDTHLVVDARSEAVIDGRDARKVGWDQALWDRSRAWRSPLEPFRVVEEGALTSVQVLARHPGVSEQVWSGSVGYPGDGAYLEFHKRHGMRGLRYWKITGNGVDLGDKHPYYPDDVESVLFRHADHFAGIVKDQLRAHHAETGRHGVVCAPFDAELFGHWWFEGPRFLEQVARRLHHDPEVDVCTVSAHLARVPPDKAVSLPEGSWGAGGGHDVWLNDELTFYWEIAYRAEDRFLSLLDRAPWRSDPLVREYLSEAGRQLLLLQASDWPFVISTRGAVDYGMRRVLDHASRFDDLGNAVEDLLVGREIDPVHRSTLERCRLVDPVFSDLDLSWWSS